MWVCLSGVPLPKPCPPPGPAFSVESIMSHDANLSSESKSPAARRRRRRWPIPVGVLAIGAVVAVWQLGLPATWFATTANAALLHRVAPTTLSIRLKEDGELAPVQSTDVKCEVQGQGLTIEWIIPESTAVKKGDLLVRLASDTFKERVEMEQIEIDSIQAALREATEQLEITKKDNETRITKAEVDLRIAELELERYVKGEFEKQLKAIDLSIAKTRTDINQAEDELKKNRTLFERNFVTQAKMDELTDRLDQLRLTLSQHELERDILLSYEKPKNEIQKQAAVNQARDELDRERDRAASRERTAQEQVRKQEALLAVRAPRFERLKEQLEKCVIYAPIDGVVQYGGSSHNWYRGSVIAAGETVSPGQTIITIPDTTQMKVNTRIHEADRHLITEGLPCLVRVPAVPGHVFTGKLISISQFADSERSWLNPDLKEHSAEILLDETDAAISPGDTAHVEILIQEVPNVLTVPVQCVYSRGLRRFVFAQTGTGPQPIEVELGRSNATEIEVVAGLNAGDDVLMHVDEQLLTQLPTGRAPESSDAEAVADASESSPAGNAADVAPAAHDTAEAQHDAATNEAADAPTAAGETAAEPEQATAEEPAAEGKRAAASDEPAASTTTPRG